MYGLYNFPQLPFNVAPAGVDLGTAQILPTGGNVQYVRSTGPDQFDPPSLTGRILPSLEAGLTQCRANRGDTVVVLPGHSQSVTDATMLNNLVDGTRIIGMGEGSDMPTFRWTATGSQWVWDNNNVSLSGVRLRLEGANGVVKALNITGTDFKLFGCDIEMASGATAKATIGVEVGSGALRGKIAGNRVRGTETHNVTDGFKVVGGTTPDDLWIVGNVMMFSATAANGLIHYTVASKRNLCGWNVLYNTHTASSATVAIDNVACDGMGVDNRSGTVNDGTASAQGFTFGAAALWRMVESYSSDEPRRTGVINPAAVAT